MSFLRATIHARLVEKARRGTRRVLEMRALAGRTAWLDGRPVWHEGRVAWQIGDTLVVVGAGELALAQRTHYKIRRYPISADLAFGDQATWLAEREARLELAKRLSHIAAPDIALLATQARAGRANAIARLAMLLEAEALCMNMLPISPAGVLAACGRQALAALGAVCDDDEAPMAARALAALVTGAITCTRRAPAAIPILVTAQAWAARHGMPGDPALVLRLLDADQSGSLAARYQAVRQSAAPTVLPDMLVRELLGDALDAHTVVALLEASAAARSIVERICTRQPWLPHQRAEREQAIAVIAGLLHRAALLTHDPQALADFVLLAHALIDALTNLYGTRPPVRRHERKGPASVEQVWRAAFAMPFEAVLALPPRLIAGGFRLLLARSEHLWGLDDADRTRLWSAAASWLRERVEGRVSPLLNLYALCEHGEAALLLYDLHLQAYVQHYALPDASMYSWWLTSMHTSFPAHTTSPDGYPIPYDRGEQADVGRYLLVLLRMFPNLQQARVQIRPILEQLASVPAGMRAMVFSTLCHELSYRDGFTMASIRALPAILPAMLAGIATRDNAYQCTWFLLAGLALVRRRPGDATGWLAWLGAYIVSEERRLGDDFRAGSISVASFLAAILAHTLAEFQHIVRALLLHSFAEDQTMLERSIRELERFAGLQAAVRGVVVEQPQRCMKLIVHLASVARIGSDATAELEQLDLAPLGAEPAFVTSNAEWQSVLALRPGMDRLVAEYYYARWLAGAPWAVPAGVGQALQQPERLARELAHLERVCEARPDEVRLARRAANLRERLVSGSMWEQAGREAAERMDQAVAIARFEAAEHLMNNIYRRRLEQIAGPLPADVAIDDDLINAAALSLDIRHNRRLLRHLIREHLAGSQDWREQHPANARFLQELAQHSIDAGAWVGAWPRVYRVGRETYRLHLETNPMRVLQMGNLFDTCLSLGEYNAFSSVTNACELNKRVLYVRNSQGRVVARKLIAVNDAWQLVGFHTYTVGHDSATQTLLWNLTSAYGAWFAKRCGLECAAAGSVPLLFAEQWYDDGLVSWQPQAPMPTIAPADTSSARS